MTKGMEVQFMIANTFIDNAKVMAKGQVTIPKDIREILGITSGDRVTFVVENGMAESAGLDSEDAVMDLVKEIRNEDSDK